MNNEREAVYVKEKKAKLDKIKKKYKNMQMSDDTANKISKLEVVNTVLKAATAVAGVVTVVDYFVPDGVFGLDEVALTAITGLLGYASTLVDNKIDKVANDEDASIQLSEVTKLSEQIGNAARAIKPKGIEQGKSINK